MPKNKVTRNYPVPGKYILPEAKLPPPKRFRSYFDAKKFADSKKKTHTVHLTGDPRNPHGWAVYLSDKGVKGK